MNRCLPSRTAKEQNSSDAAVRGGVGGLQFCHTEHTRSGLSVGATVNALIQLPTPADNVALPASGRCSPLLLSTRRATNEGLSTNKSPTCAVFFCFRLPSYDPGRRFVFAIALSACLCGDVSNRLLVSTRCRVSCMSSSSSLTRSRLGP